jgi:hypothetical protein
VTVTYVGTASFPIIVYAHQVAYSNFAALDSQINSSYLSGTQMQVPLYGSGIVHSYNLPNVTLAAPLVRAWPYPTLIDAMLMACCSVNSH